MPCQDINWVIADSPNNLFTVQGDNSLLKDAGTRALARSDQKIYNLAGGYFSYTAPSRAELQSGAFPAYNSIGLNNTMPTPDPDSDNDYEFEYTNVLGQYRIQEEVAGYGGPNSTFADGDTFLMRIASDGSKVVTYEKNSVLIRTSTNLANLEFYYAAVEATRTGVVIPNLCFYGNVWITKDADEISIFDVLNLVGHGGTGAADYEWSADGGTFDFDSGVAEVVWTPPAVPGVYTITLTDGDSSWETTIVVIFAPLTLSGPSTYLHDSLPLPVFVAAGGAGAALYEWTASGGTFDVDSGVDTVEWTPPVGAFGRYTIFVTDGDNTAEHDIIVIGVVDLTPSFPVDIETRKQVFVSQAETGIRESVRKSKSYRFYTLPFNSRTQAEYAAFEPIWSAHYPEFPFEWVHSVLDASGEFYFDSALKWTPARNNLLNYSLMLKRKTALTTAEPESNVMPFAPSYGYEGNPTRENLVSDAVDLSRQAAGLSAQKHLFNLVFRARSLAELLEMELFWDWHYPGRQISFTDPVLDVDGDFWIDSNFKWRVLARNLVEYSFDVREV